MGLGSGANAHPTPWPWLRGGWAAVPPGFGQPRATSRPPFGGHGDAEPSHGWKHHPMTPSLLPLKGKRGVSPWLGLCGHATPRSVCSRVEAAALRGGPSEASSLCCRPPRVTSWTRGSWDGGCKAQLQPTCTPYIIYSSPCKCVRTSVQTHPASSAVGGKTLRAWGWTPHLPGRSFPCVGPLSLNEYRRLWSL